VAVELPDDAALVGVREQAVEDVLRLLSQSDGRRRLVEVAQQLLTAADGGPPHDKSAGAQRGPEGSAGGGPTALAAPPLPSAAEQSGQHEATGEE